MKLSKRARRIQETVDQFKVYPMQEAVGVLTELSTVKFTESFEVAINLGVDPRKSDQVVRGSKVLTHGTGKKVRVAVFAQGVNAEAAVAVGAEFVGMEDLAEKIKGGEMGFDVVIASPDSMRVVGQLGQVLGPRGLMPNPKVGTVTADVVTAIKNAKAGQVRFRTDKKGIIHCAIGKIGFSGDALVDNLNDLVGELTKLKPASAKGIYIKKITLSTTMGPGITIDQTSLSG